NVSARRQWVEEALPDRCDALGHAGGPKYLGGERDGTREINKRSAHPRTYAKNLCKHCSCAPADVDHVRRPFPAAGDLELRVRPAMSWRPDEVVEARRDLGMGVQVFPERQAEDFVVGGLARTDIIEERSPCVCHAAADAIEVKPDTPLRVE